MLEAEPRAAARAGALAAIPALQGNGLNRHPVRLAELKFGAGGDLHGNVVCGFALIIRGLAVEFDKQLGGRRKAGAIGAGDDQALTDARLLASRRIERQWDHETAKIDIYSNT